MRGYVDEVSPGWVSGWFDGDSPPSVFINGQRVGEANATGERPDAGGAARGFYRRITRYLTPGPNTIAVKSGDKILPNGEWTIDYDPNAVVNQHWSQALLEGRNLVTRWVQSDRIVRHINKRVCGKDIPGLSQGLFVKLKQDYARHLPAKVAVSVGCGTGTKEMDMLEADLVERFELYDLAEGALESGRQEAIRRGLIDRVTFNHGDGFVEAKGPYDMVLWISALHHMPNVHAALRWSRSVLKDGGIFVMDEYVGATRFQFSQEVLDVNTNYRKSLPKELLVNPYRPEELVDTELVNIDIDELILLDPSEAVDAGNILPAFRETFPKGDVIFTGGAVYHCAMCDILHNFKDDPAEIDKGLAVDDECCDRSITQYAVAIAVK